LSHPISIASSLRDESSKGDLYSHGHLPLSFPPSEKSLKIAILAFTSRLLAKDTTRPEAQLVFLWKWNSESSMSSKRAIQPEGMPIDWLNAILLASK
jgi:hypothetical protein